MNKWISPKKELPPLGKEVLGKVIGGVFKNLYTPMEVETVVLHSEYYGLGWSLRSSEKQSWVLQFWQVIEWEKEVPDPIEILNPILSRFEILDL